MIMKTIDEIASEFASHSYIEDGEIRTYVNEVEKQSYIKGAIDQHEREMGRLNDVLNALMIDTRDKCKIFELMEK